MLCIGHRGAMGHEPENTLRSIQKALSLGVDVVEVDVYNVERRLVVIHDRDLGRTTNGTGYVEEYSFADLRALDAGKGEKIPTLEEVFNTVNRQAVIDIELKGNNTAELVVDLIREYLNQGWSWSDFIVSSFNHEELHQVKSICAEIKTGMLIYGLPWRYLAILQQLRAEVLIASIDFVNPDLIASAHRLGVPVWIYTVNQAKEIDRLRGLGVDGIVTNYPERVLGSISNSH
ncbi:MAG: glycerophosphodiester phosphodiesterase family protein [Cyanobacteria bacterium J06621_8]